MPPNCPEETLPCLFTLPQELPHPSRGAAGRDTGASSSITTGGRRRAAPTPAAAPDAGTSSMDLPPLAGGARRVEQEGALTEVAVPPRRRTELHAVRCCTHFFPDGPLPFLFISHQIYGRAMADDYLVRMASSSVTPGNTGAGHVAAGEDALARRTPSMVDAATET